MRFLCFFVLLRAVPAYAEAVFLGSYEWSVTDPRFGGFSAIEVTPDGSGFIALSDRGSFVEGRFERERGIINDVELTGLHRLTNENGVALQGKENDSEGLAVGAEGLLWVSFEAAHGIRKFDGIDQPASPLITSAAFERLQINSSLEALAIGPDGALYTMPERSGRATTPFPVYRFKDGVWDQPFDIRRTGPYLISGADIGPDGLLYILERDFAGIGFRNRIRRFALDGSNEELILETGLRTHDNLEGISVWKDTDGLRITLISDDNFRSFQRTEIVEYRLTQ
nr:esterase-like activity of phytase family protein [Yoonia sp. F2084L]